MKEATDIKSLAALIAAFEKALHITPVQAAVSDGECNLSRRLSAIDSVLNERYRNSRGYRSPRTTVDYAPTPTYTIRFANAWRELYLALEKSK